MTIAMPICALVYEDGAVAQEMLVRLVKELREAGKSIAGTIQYDRARPDRRHCDMMLENLASGETVRISEDRGALATGCRLDRDAFARVEAAVRQSLDAAPSIMIINKFGKTEIEGGGLRAVIADALEKDIPTLVGVPERNIVEWTAFVGEHACEARGEADLRRWLGDAGVV